MTSLTSLLGTKHVPWSRKLRYTWYFLILLPTKFQYATICSDTWFPDVQKGGCHNSVTPVHPNNHPLLEKHEVWYEKNIKSDDRGASYMMCESEDVKACVRGQIETIHKMKKLFSKGHLGFFILRAGQGKWCLKQRHSSSLSNFIDQEHWFVCSLAHLGWGQGILEHYDTFSGQMVCLKTFFFMRAGDVFPSSPLPRCAPGVVGSDKAPLLFNGRRIYPFNKGLRIYGGCTTLLLTR